MKDKFKILVACEESQEVCKAFREIGFEAYSCDTQDCSGGHPEWHIKGDAIEEAYTGKYDLIIAFPPCTHIARTGGRWYSRKREDGSQKEGLLFFTKLAEAPAKYKAIENPAGILSSPTYIQNWFPEILPAMKEFNLPRRPDQVIEPFYFGHDKKKETGLWLFGLPPLIHTCLVEPEKPFGYITRKGKYRTGSKRAITWLDKATAKEKAKTFPGVAKAMAQQWGNFILTSIKNDNPAGI